MNRPKRNLKKPEYFSSSILPSQEEKDLRKALIASKKLCASLESKNSMTISSSSSSSVVPLLSSVVSPSLSSSSEYLQITRTELPVKSTAQSNHTVNNKPDYLGADGCLPGPSTRSCSHPISPRSSHTTPCDGICSKSTSQPGPTHANLSTPNDLPATTSLHSPPFILASTDGSDTLPFHWGCIPGNEFIESVEQVYEKVVFWRRNFFLVPNNSSGRAFVTEAVYLLNAFAERNPLERISMKAISIMFHLLLQRPHRKSTTHENKQHLARRMVLWKSGDISGLFREAQMLQRLFSSRKRSSIPLEDIFRHFNHLMLLGKVNAATRLITEQNKGGIHSLSPQVLSLLQQKHPHAEPLDPQMKISGCLEDINPVRFEGITGDIIRQSALHTRGAAGPSGADADQWKQMCTAFGDISSNLCNALAGVAKRLATDTINPKYIEVFLANRLIPLDKCPGVRPIGIGEVPRRIIGKTIVRHLKEEIQMASGPIQLCAGLNGGCEAAVHAVQKLFENDDCEAVLLVDADNAFNRLNRSVALWNIQFICPYLAAYATNCYQTSARLFICGGAEIQSEEGTTQGDPLAMPFYALSLVPLIKELHGLTHHIWYADDAQATGKIESLRHWWNKIIQRGQGYGYFANASKTILVVKPNHIEKAQMIFQDTGVKLTEGARDLGAAVGTQNFIDHYVAQKVSQFCREMELLSDIAVSYPQAALSAFVHSIKHRWRFIQRTVPNLSNAFEPLERVIRNTFIPSLLGGHIVNDDERLLISLPGKYGGLAIDNPMETCNGNLSASTQISEQLVSHLEEQKSILEIDKEKDSQCRSSIHKERQRMHKETVEQLTLRLQPERTRAMIAAQEKGASFIVTTLPLKAYGFALSKQEFRDQLLLRYKWPIPNLQLTCACGRPYTVDHSQICHLGGFINQRHDEVRDLFASEMKKVWKDVETEPSLTPLSGETIFPRSAINDDHARADIRVRGLWNRQQNAFFDVMVFYPHASSYLSKNIPTLYKQFEDAKRRQYSDRILNIEYGSFTPLVFSSTGGMGKDATVTLRKIAKSISEKTHENVSSIMGLLRCRISFALIRAANTCLRGTKIRRCLTTDGAATDLINNQARISGEHL